MNTVCRICGAHTDRPGTTICGECAIIKHALMEMPPAVPRADPDRPAGSTERLLGWLAFVAAAAFLFFALGRVWCR